MFPAQFQMLEELVRPIIQRKNTNYRDSISGGERLMVTLRFLATGNQTSVYVVLSTIRQFVPETCQAIYQVLKDKYVKCPDTALEWQQVATGFLSQWNFPNCIGALDGKHINIRPPPGSGSTFYNYKHHFSIVLMAMVDSYYRFLYVDVGCQGRVSDGGVFAGCTLADALENRTTNIPDPAPLPGSDQLSPYCIVADEAFPLKEYLMKPYPHRGLPPAQRVFNYRLSRARRVVENAFGILASRFRVLQTTINIQDTAKVENIVLACCALHNFLRTESCEVYMADMVDREGPDDAILAGRWREDPALQQASLPRATNATTRAKLTRDNLCQYFMSDCGAVPFQWVTLQGRQM
uniref:DDE Tnp4 domain-containing protein n=1 Tax=Sparus aurata TaxID=8175 RepID=A0A671UPW4_SPAAU